ncbi:hypothetical protein D3C72_1799480 [compost metagenome]
MARIAAVDDHGQRVDAVVVDQQVHAHHVGRAVFQEFVVHRGIAARHRLQLVEEVQHDLGQRDLVHQVHLAAVIAHVDLRAALVVAQRHDRTDVVLRHEQRDLHDGFADVLDLAHFRHA